MAMFSYQFKTQLGMLREAGEGKEARLPVLMWLVLSANNRNRAWAKADTIAEQIGHRRAGVLAALQWLADHKAIVNVQPKYRQGREAQISTRSPVWQLTGVLEVDGAFHEYLHMPKQARQDAISELQAMGEDEIAIALDLDDAESTDNGPSIGPVSDSSGSEKRTQQSPVFDHLPLYGTESSERIEERNGASAGDDGDAGASDFQKKLAEKYGFAEGAALVAWLNEWDALTPERKHLIHVLDAVKARIEGGKHLERPLDYASGIARNWAGNGWADASKPYVPAPHPPAQPDATQGGKGDAPYKRGGDDDPRYAVRKKRTAEETLEILAAMQARHAAILAERGPQNPMLRRAVNGG